ncbi:hypothetical protein ACF0H5_014718 [Mactra antiquata]
MSETEPVLEPVPVTKEATSVVNGNDDDLPPPDSDLLNGINKQDIEMDVQNGHSESMVDPVPINGGYDDEPNMDDKDVDEVDELPPPPEIVPDLPPPPPVACPTGDDFDDPFGSSVDPVMESSVDPEQDVECVDENEDLMNVSDSECPDEPPPCEDTSKPVVEDVSEEELVSDGGLKEEVDVEIQNNQQNEEVEQMSEGQLIDVSEPNVQEEDAPLEPVSPLVETVESPCEPEQPMEASVPPVEEPTNVVPDVPEDELLPETEVETVPEPKIELVREPVVEIQPEPVVEAMQEPVVEAAPEPVVEAAPEPVVEPAPEPVVEPAPEPVVEVAPEPVVEEAPEPVVEVAPEPDVEKVPEPVVEMVPEPVVEKEPEPEVTPEPEVVEVQEPNVPIVQIGLSEPDIIIDNKPVDMDQAPPPPPPLQEDTPPPPPPLDDNIPLRRVSGSSTPNKQSPSKELDSPVAISAPVSVAVVCPQPEPVETKQEAQPESEPVPTPEPLSSSSSGRPEHVNIPTTQPVAVVAPQVVMESTSSSSPPASPGPTSQPSPTAEGERSLVSAQVSQKINKKNFKNKIKFGVDLVEATLKQLHFVTSVNKHCTLYEEWLFKKAIRRYEAFWLPMAAEHKKECLAAPLDIEWIWHCHLLAPLFYEADCKALVGLVVDHKVMGEKDRMKSLEKSRKYWTAKYPNEPFEIDLVFKEKVEEPVNVPEQSTNDAGEEKTTEKTEEGTVADSKDEEKKEADGDNKTNETEGETNDTSNTTETTTQPQPEAAPVQNVPAEVSVPEENYEQKSTYNIFGSISRQRVFHYQTSLTHYHDKHFLKAAQKRYQRFIFLKHQNPQEFLVPCYDIDVMWHSHQLHPSVYKHDTVKVLGQVLAHDDSVNDRSVGSRLIQADQKTRDLWKELFGDNIMTFGAMFRGEPPILCERMSMIEPVETYTFSTKKATVNLDKVQVEGLPEEVNKYSVKLAYGGYNEREGPMIKQFKGNKKKIEFENTKKGLAHFVFDTKEYDRLMFNMSQQIGFACAGHDEEIGQQIFSLMPVVENIPMGKEDASNLVDTVTIDYEQNLTATFTATIEPPKQGPTLLYMNPGNFESRFCIMPEQIVQMWGPIPLPRLPTGKDNHCIVASHKLVNHTGEVTFTCRVIHSLPLLMSAIQIFYHNRMTAVAHLIGSDQIPLPSQLSEPKKIFSLNPGEDQRALVIKNKHGDWGLIRGQWTGFRKHQPAVAATKGKKAKKEVPWSPGTLSISFYKCASGVWQHITLPYAQENFRFTIQDSNIDLKTGTIEVQSDSNEVAENLALSFSVALLHVLCQPRYQPPVPPEPIPVTVETPPTPTSPKEQAEDTNQETPGQGGAQAEGTDETKPEVEEAPKTPKSPAKSEPPTPSKKVKEIPAIPTCELAFILAAGYNVDTPTTDSIKKQYGANACAGCAAMGIDVGVGTYGEVAPEITAELEVAEAVADTEVGDGDNVAVETSNTENVAGDIDTAGMDGIGDAGAAACGAF